MRISANKSFVLLTFCFSAKPILPSYRKSMRQKTGKRYSCWKHWKSSNLISLSLYTFITCAQLSVDVLKSDDIESKLKGYVSQAFLTTSSNMYEKETFWFLFIALPAASHYVMCLLYLTKFLICLETGLLYLVMQKKGITHA